jgi:hypothetical protein
MDAIPHVDLGVGLMVSIRNYAVILSDQYIILRLSMVPFSRLHTTGIWNHLKSVMHDDQLQSIALLQDICDTCTAINPSNIAMCAL